MCKAVGNLTQPSIIQHISNWLLWNRWGYLTLQHSAKLHITQMHQKVWTTSFVECNLLSSADLNKRQPYQRWLVNNNDWTFSFKNNNELKTTRVGKQREKIKQLGSSKCAKYFIVNTGTAQSSHCATHQGIVMMASRDFPTPIHLKGTPSSSWTVST